jgi:hypothetical protein
MNNKVSAIFLFWILFSKYKKLYANILLHKVFIFYTYILPQNGENFNTCNKISFFV